MISYTPVFMPTKILIIGCGGTGSRLVPLLAQFIKTCPWVIDPEITLVDDDVVEEKNLLRQNFISTDVGKSKAAVLAQRYSRAFNVRITAHQIRIKGKVQYFGFNCPEDIKVPPVQEGIFINHSHNSIIILCVDSPEARQDIISNMGNSYSNSNILVIDSGNENNFGQVSISTWKKFATEYSKDPVIDILIDMDKNKVPADIKLAGIPVDLSYFQDMVAADNLSCADLDQTMAINSLMANTIFGVVQNHYYAKPCAFHKLNVSLDNGITPEYISPRWLMKLLDFKNKNLPVDFTLRKSVIKNEMNPLIRDAPILCPPHVPSLPMAETTIKNYYDREFYSFMKIVDAQKKLDELKALKEKKAAEEALTEKIKVQIRAKVLIESRDIIRAEVRAELLAALPPPISDSNKAGEESNAPIEISSMPNPKEDFSEDISKIKAELKKQETARAKKLKDTLKSLEAVAATVT